MFRIIVVGARGYTGAELLPLLHRHPGFDLVAVGSGSAAGEMVSSHVRGMDGCQLKFADIDPSALARLEADACVLALPNGAASGYVEILDRHRPETVVVDLSADYRFDPDWAYGQPERFADRLAGARRIANPGCYATAAQLALAPLTDRLVGTPAAMTRRCCRTTCCPTHWWTTSTNGKYRTTSDVIFASCLTWRHSSGASA
jgi:N-acetyl-gamma-glutamyl-phosphate reductase